MARSTRRFSLPSAASTALIATIATVAGLTALPAMATTVDPVAPPSSSSVIVLLKAPNAAALRALAAAQGLTHAQRVTAVDRLLPSAATHARVASELRASGFTVTGETAWTVSAHASTDNVTSAFGTPQAVPTDATPLERVRAQTTLPKVPASIAGLAAVALPTSGAPNLLSPLETCAGCFDGTDFRNAYTAPKVTPTTGSDANGQLTIATLQFAGWNRSDLASYAKEIGVPNPLTNNNGNTNGHLQYTQIPVGETTVPKASASEHGADEEVDLDQESILSTDPAANQRAYFSPNSSGASYVQDLSKVFADVTQGEGDSNDGGDPKIAALSTSWGSCESEFQLAFHGTTINAVENVLTSLTAAGVTVFAASGDDGVYDCGVSGSSSKIAVDYPAASPEVVAVGGTHLAAKGAKAANDGRNWNDTAWTCTSTQVCQGERAGDTGGTGGGESSVKQFALPAYQKAGIGSQPFTTSTGKKGNFGSQPRRLVPDISADGDPQSGFGVLTTDPVDACAGSTNPTTCAHLPPATTLAIGGTSLSSPVSAALFTDLLGAHSVTHGIGDIHDALYSAYAAHDGAFRDVTSGRNGKQADVDHHASSKTAAELPVNAQTGYDTVSGLGTPLWPAIAPYLFAAKPATARPSVALPTPTSATHPGRLRVKWRGRQARAGAWTAVKADVTVTRKGTAAAVYHRAGAPANGSYTFEAKPGNYVVTLSETSLGGKRSTTKTATTIVPYDDRTFTYSGDWSQVRGGSDFGGSAASGSGADASAQTTRYGRSFTLIVRKAPDAGELTIAQGDATIGTYNLHAAKAHHALITFYSAPHDKKRTFTFRAGSDSRPVEIDGLYVGR